MIPIEFSMTIETLRREWRWEIDMQMELIKAIRDKQELPSPRVLTFLSRAGNRDDHAEGCRLQRIHKLEKIPPVYECEKGAGVWARILKGLNT